MLPQIYIKTIITDNQKTQTLKTDKGIRKNEIQTISLANRGSYEVILHVFK